MSERDEREQAQVLSAYWDASIVRRGTDKPDPPAPEAAADLDELIDLARLVGSVDIVPRPEFGGELLARVAGAIAAESRKQPAETKPSRLRVSFEAAAGLAVLALRRPAFRVGAAIALVSALFLPWLRGPRVSAAERLRDATVMEETGERGPDVVVHRRFNVEARRIKPEAVVARYRVDIWRTGSAAGRVREARRAYNAGGQLVGGEWTYTDGRRTVYRPGATPEAASPPPLASGEIWRLDPSAKSFSSLVTLPDKLEVEELQGQYRLTYEAAQADTVKGLLRATLVLDKTSLEARYQSLVVREAGEEREYRFTDAERQRVPARAVTRALFEPEPELLPAVVKSPLPEPRDALVLPALSEAEVDQLEMDALLRLHRLDACLHAPVRVLRTGPKALRVEGEVAGGDRVERLRKALASLGHSDAVRVELQPGAAHAPPAAHWTGGAAAASPSAIPAYPILRDYFSKELRVQASPADVEPRLAAVAIGYAQRALDRSARARAHAVAATSLVMRWSDRPLVSNDLDAAATWHSMVRDHARAVQHETEALRLELQPVFFAGFAFDPAVDRVEEPGLLPLAKELSQSVQLADQALRAFFVVPADPAGATHPNRDSLWRALQAAESLARRLDAPFLAGTPRPKTPQAPREKGRFR